MNGNWYKKSKIWPKEMSISDGLNPVFGLPKVSSFKSIDPNRILVDMEARGRPLQKTDKNEISKFLGDVSRKYWDHIPLQEIFDKLDSHGVVPLQEDGTRWQGMLLGDKECGSPGSETQRAHFRLAFRQPDGKWTLSSNCILLLWCRLFGRENAIDKRYEIVTYVS
jgi:hypothetical protein